MIIYSPGILTSSEKIMNAADVKFINDFFIIIISTFLIIDLKKTIF